MQSTEPARARRFVTIVRNVEGLPQVKVQVRQPDRSVAADQIGGKWFEHRTVEFQTLEELRQITGTLTAYECVVPGIWNGVQPPNPTGAITLTKRDIPSKKQVAYLTDAGASWLTFDIDKGIPVPPGLGWHDPAAIAQHVWAHLQQIYTFLQGVGCMWKTSGSAGIPGKEHDARLHMTVLLSEPLLEHDRKAILQLMRDHVDQSMWQSSRRHYFATRICQGFDDPLANAPTSGVFEGAPLQYIATPKPAERVTTAPTFTAETTPEGRRHLERECAKIAALREGERHERVLKLAKTIGGYVGNGTVALEDARAAMLHAVSGFKNPERHEHQIEDGLESGINLPWPTDAERAANALQQQFGDGLGNYMPAGARHLTPPGGIPQQTRPAVSLPPPPGYEKTSLIERFLEHPERTDVFHEVARLPKPDRTEFINATWRGAVNYTKAEMTKAIDAIEVENKRLAMAAQGFLTDPKGDLLQCAENAARTLETSPVWQGVLVHDAFRQEIRIMRQFPGHVPDHGETYPVQLTEADALLVMRWLHSNGYPQLKKNVVWDVVVAVSRVNSHHPVRDYLNSLEWDHKERLPDLWTHYFSVEADPEIPGHDEYLREAGKRFAIGAVARVMRPGCKVDTLPVLSSSQGFKKSTGAEVLCSEDWFGDDCPDVTRGTAAKEWVSGGVWIAEMAEMQSIRGKAVEGVKSFLSTRVDKYRPAYGRVVEAFKRELVFFGTVNGDEYLNDPTGGRRFWPMRVVNTVRVEEIQRDRDQLWAEAVWRLNNGERWWFDQGECPALEVSQENVREKTILQERVADHLRTCPDGVRLSAVADSVAKGDDGAKFSKDLSDAMRLAGWKSVNRASLGGRVWIRTHLAEPQSSGAPQAAPQPVHGMALPAGPLPHGAIGTPPPPPAQ